MILFLVALVSVAQAKYAAPQLEQVPVERAVANLERRLKATPRAGEGAPESLLLPLARLHVMAFVLPEKIVGMEKGSDLEFEWPYASPIEHFHPVEKPLGKRAHLDRALELYAQVLAREPKNWIARLGVAWTHDQAGRRPEALREYRAILSDSLDTLKESPKDGRKNLLGYDVGAEAATYLVTMLDKKRDAAEVKRVQDDQAKIYARISRTRFLSPIVIPDRPGLKLADIVDANSPVKFDLGGTGIAERWGWLKPNAAFLVYRDRPDRRIESGLQLFGSVTFGAFWSNGYAALSSLDDNGDGIISGEELAGLGLWKDVNRDGIGQPDEITDARIYGICEIRLDFETAPDGTPMNRNGARMRNRKVLPTYDWTPSVRTNEIRFVAPSFRGRIGE